MPMTSITTHQAIPHSLVGRPVSIEVGEAPVEPETTTEMGVNDRRPDHGRYVYRAADR